jgi:hypothetical protein
MMLDHEALQRLLRRIAEGKARALKLALSGKPDEALVALRELCTEVLGMEFSVLSMLDPKSAVDLLGAHQRVLAYVEIVEAMGDVEQPRDPAAALSRYQRALHLAAVLHERDGAKPALAELSQRLLERIS